MPHLLSLSLHALSCLLSLFLGFCFSRLFYLSPPPLSLSPLPRPPPSLLRINTPSPPPPPPPPPRPTTGRHAILVRPYPHPNPIETLKAHRILSSVQSEQRRLHISPNLPSPPRTFLVITPTYSRTFQTLHLSSLAHALLILPFNFTWIVLEPRGSVNDTAAVLARFPRMNVLRLRFDGVMPDKWAPRRRVEAQMRLLALREIRERRLEGIIVFLDESNIHTMEFFDEAQKVKRIGLASVGILVHGGPGLGKDDDEEQEIEIEEEKKGKSKLGFPVIGPVCNKSGHFIGFHSFNSSNYTGKIAEFVGEEGLVLPSRIEWAGFVMDSKVLWDERLDLVRAFNAGEIDSPLDFVKDPSFIEPIGDCSESRKVLVWWNRVETRPGIKYPTRWVIEKPLENVVLARITPWPKTQPEFEIEDFEFEFENENQNKRNLNPVRENVKEKRSSKIVGRSSRSKRRSRGKRKREGRANFKN
ncbi:hypothetical protein LUZ60_017139 [Juncus effusus]|nr:hypothetical protein LUZ60_017139 [Juncus effusus]